MTRTTAIGVLLACACAGTAGIAQARLAEGPRALAATAQTRGWEARGGADRWIRAALDTIAASRSNPVRASRALALVSVAMNGALGTASRSRVAGRLAPAAIAGAAATTLDGLFPGRSTSWSALRREAERAVLASGATRQADRRAVRLGAGFGRRALARARNDGADAVWTGQRPTGEGYWEPTPSAYAPPLEPLAGTWRTWNLIRGSQYRPAPPPAFGTPEFRGEAAEVYDISTSLTDEQRKIALYWADGPGTVTPPGHWNVIALELAGRARMSARQTTKLLAILNTAQADAFIACWDAKYFYWRVRPVTVLRILDPSWLPLLQTPPFPSYPSGHATTSGAASAVLAHFFPLRASGLRRLAGEAALSRLYAGIHFRSDNDAGLQLGRRVGLAALRASGRTPSRTR